MKKETDHHEPELIDEIIFEISEVGRRLKGKQNLPYAFNPLDKIDKEKYRYNMMLMTVIHDLLNECCINIKSRGYSYIMDAVCIIIDQETLDVCMNKDIYPFIARKHDMDGIGRVEHDIRNSINAAYRLYINNKDRNCPFMERFDSKPTPKAFLLYLKEEVDRRLWLETSDC